jgi:hypothetical protein
VLMVHPSDPQMISNCPDSSQAIEPIVFKSLEQFKGFCLENLADDLRKLEKTRHQILNQLAIVGMVITLFLSGLIYFLPLLLDLGADNPAKLKLFSYWLGGIIFWLWAIVAFYSSSTEAYGQGFKNKIILKIVDFIVSRHRFAHPASKSKDATLEFLIKSRLFPSLNKKSHISQDDCFSGTIGKTTFFFSEVRVEAELARGAISKLITAVTGIQLVSSIVAPLFIITLMVRVAKGFPYFIGRVIKGQRIDYDHFEREVLWGVSTGMHVFKGLFFVADFNKDFQGKTFVSSNNFSSKVQNAVQLRGQVVQLEDTRFSKFFTVCSNDQVEARYILSTRLMERLITFQKKANRKIQIAFVDSLIYIAIAYEEDLFEPKLFSSMLDLAPLKEYFETLQLMLSIVDELNLNQRIWTKR